MGRSSGIKRTESEHFDSNERLKRQFHQVLDDTQYLMHECADQRTRFWSKADDRTPESWKASCGWYREYFERELLGRSPAPSIPANPRSRLLYDTPAFIGYEVVLDVYPRVFAYGILLVPKDVEPGERRPVVVCQHGLEGTPQNVADPAE